MILSRPLYSTRSLSLIVLVAFAGASLWFFAPWAGSNAGDGSASPSNDGAALPSSLKIDGSVQVESHDDIVTRLVVPLFVRGDEGIALSDDFRLHAETAMADTAVAAVPATYSVRWLDGNGDRVLDVGEHALLTVDLPAVSTVHPGNPLRLVLRTPGGATLAIEDVLSAAQ